jgi:riboflavin kinase/FMN adenylyltransferase
LETKESFFVTAQVNTLPMQVIQNLNSVHLPQPTVLTIGTFDGLHRGHQTLLRQLQQSAAQRATEQQRAAEQQRVAKQQRAAEQEQQAQTAVLTFHPRPKTVLAPHLDNNDYLTTPAERMALFEQLGLDVLIIIPFTLEFAQTSARDFMKMVTKHINLVEFWAGHDFALGKNREGNLAKLSELGQEFNYIVCEVEPFWLDGQIVSSTQIRQLLRAGQVRQAAHLLGRYPAITGQVGPGAQRGRQLGFPTTNLIVPPERLLPENGVYATFVWLNKDRLPGVTNVGVRPSFEGNVHTVETFIFDFDQDIYGQPLTLEFVERLRPEKKFDNIDELVAQISQDAKQAQALLIKET